MASRSCLYVFLLLLLAFQSISTKANVLPPPLCRTLPASTLDRIEFILNLLFLKAQFFLRSSVGLGINDIAPGLVQGPVTTGASVAVLDDSTRRIIEEFGLATVGHIRAIVRETALNAPLPSPQLNLSSGAFPSAGLNNITLDIYASQNVFLIAAEFITSIITQYLAYITPLVTGNDNQRLIAGISLNTAAQNGAIRSRLNAAFDVTVPPLTITVADLTSITAAFRNQLGMCGEKDEGLVVPLELGAENRTTSNVVAADVSSLAFPHTERECMRIMFSSGIASRRGGLYPGGCVGSICHLVIQILRLP